MEMKALSELYFRCKRVFSTTLSGKEKCYQNFNATEYPRMRAKNYPQLLMLWVFLG